MRSLITKAALALGLAYPIPAYSAEFYNQTLDDGTEAILIMGDIVEGDEERFRELSIRFPHAIVGLESDGAFVAMKRRSLGKIYVRQLVLSSGWGVLGKPSAGMLDWASMRAT